MRIGQHAKRALVLALALLAECAAGQGGGDLYGDMLVLDRDARGVPILTEAGGHVRPIVFGDAIPLDCPFDGAFVQVDHPDSIYLGELVYYVPLDAEGEIPEAYGACGVEVELGRLSVARAPASVMEQALAEAERILALGGGAGALSLDAAGRLIVTYVDPDTGSPATRTLDSSLANLSIFERLLERGNLASIDIVGTLPGGMMDRAAAMLGAAADKGGRVTVDVLVYLAAILAIPDETVPDAGVPAPHQVGETRYYDFSGFAYDRERRFGDSYLCYMRVVTDPATGQPVPDPGGTANRYLVEMVTETPFRAVFGEMPYAGSNALAFAQAADDARAVIEFLHAHPVPVELAQACPAARVADGAGPAPPVAVFTSGGGDGGCTIDVATIDPTLALLIATALAALGLGRRRRG